jgi:hypothetical protein
MLVMGRQRCTRWREGESYPAISVQGLRIEGESLVRCQCRRKEKKGIKKQRRSKNMDWREKGLIVAVKRGLKIGGAANHPVRQTQMRGDFLERLCPRLFNDR